MPNMKQLISSHNKSVISKVNEPTDIEKKCNCQQPSTCPLPQNCLSSGIVYQATVTTDNSKETYVGLTDTTFKERYGNHKNSFKDSRKRHATKLSKYIWSLKDSGISYNLEWKVLSKRKAYLPISNRCNLCLREKYFIICKPEMASLNNRNELATECMHRRKHLLVKPK